MFYFNPKNSTAGMAHQFEKTNAAGFQAQQVSVILT